MDAARGVPDGGSATAGGGDSAPPAKRARVGSSPAVMSALDDAPEVQALRQHWEEVTLQEPVTDEQIREAMRRAGFYKSKTPGYADEVLGRNSAYENLEALTHVPRVRMKLAAAGVAERWVCSGKGHETRVFNAIRNASGDEDAAVERLVKAQRKRDEEQSDAADRQASISRRQGRRLAAAAQQRTSTSQHFIDLTSHDGEHLQVARPALPQPDAAEAAEAVEAAPQVAGLQAAVGSAHELVPHPGDEQADEQVVMFNGRSGSQDIDVQDSLGSCGAAAAVMAPVPLETGKAAKGGGSSSASAVEKADVNLVCVHCKKTFTSLPGLKYHEQHLVCQKGGKHQAFVTQGDGGTGGGTGAGVGASAIAIASAAGAGAGGGNSGGLTVGSEVQNSEKNQPRKKAAVVQPEAQPAQHEQPTQPAPNRRGAARATLRSQHAAAKAKTKGTGRGPSDDVTWVARRGDWRARGSCTACGADSRTEPLLTVPHPLLQVDVCVECLHNYNQTNFSLSDESTEEQYCRWCADGGTQIAICDNEGCRMVFCHSCINRNLGANTVNGDSQDAWICLVCEPERLRGLQGKRSARLKQPNCSDSAQRIADRIGRLLPSRRRPPPALHLAHCPPPQGKAAKPPSLLAAAAEAKGASAAVAASLASDTDIGTATFGNCTACGAQGCQVKPHPFLCRDPASAPTAWLCASFPQKSGGGCEQAYRKAVEDGKFLPDGSGCEVTCTWCAGVADADILLHSLETARSSVNNSGNSGRASTTDPVLPRRGHRKPPIYSKLKGELLACALCPAAFCASCVELNFGLPLLETMAEKSLKGKWTCFVCEPSTLPACPTVAHAGVEGHGSSAGSHADVYCFSQQWPSAARNMHLREPGRVGLLATSTHKLGRRDSQQMRRHLSIAQQQAERGRSFHDAQFQRGDVCIATKDGCDYPSRVLDVRLASMSTWHKYEYRVGFVGWKEQHDEWAVVSKGGGGGESKITLAPKNIEATNKAGEQVAEIEAAATRFITFAQDYTYWENLSCTVKQGEYKNMEGNVVESAMHKDLTDGCWGLFHWIDFGGEGFGDWVHHKHVTFPSADDGDDAGAGAAGLEGRTEVVAGRFRLKRADKLAQHSDIDDTGAAGGVQGARMARDNDDDSSERHDHTANPDRFPTLHELFLPVALRMPVFSSSLQANNTEKDEVPSAVAAAAAVAHHDVLICASSSSLPRSHCAASGRQQATVQLVAQWRQNCAAVVAALYPPGQVPLDSRDTVRFRQGRTAAGTIVTIGVAEVFVGKQTAAAQLKPLLVLVGQLSWHPAKHGGQLRAVVFGQHVSGSATAASTGGPPPLIRKAPPNLANSLAMQQDMKMKSPATKEKAAVWTEEERFKLMQLIARDGLGNWGAKADELGTRRTSSAVSNQWYDRLSRTEEGMRIAKLPGMNSASSARAAKAKKTASAVASMVAGGVPGDPSGKAAAGVESTDTGTAISNQRRASGPKEKSKHEKWSPEDKAALLRLVAAGGPGKWAKKADEFPNGTRTATSLCNQWVRLKTTAEGKEALETYYNSEEGRKSSGRSGSNGGGSLQPWTGPELAIAAVLLRPSTTAQLFVLCDGQCWTAAAAAPTGGRTDQAQVWLMRTADDTHQFVQPPVKGGWVAELRGLGRDGFDSTTAAVQTDQRVGFVAAETMKRKAQEEIDEEMAAATNAAQTRAEVARLRDELADERERSRSLEARLQQLTSAPAAAATAATAAAAAAAASSPQVEESTDSTMEQGQRPQQQQQKTNKVEFVKPSKLTIICHPSGRDRCPFNGTQPAGGSAARFKHWPHSVHFTSQAFFDTLAVRSGDGDGGLCPPQLLARKTAMDFEMAGTEIRQITDPDHPCYCDAEHSQGGEYSYGLFATQDFPCGTYVGQYAGAVKPRRLDDTSRYLVPFWVDRDTGVEYDIDAEHFGNEARFINHFGNVPMQKTESRSLASNRGATQRTAYKEANVEFVGANCATTGQYFIAVMTRKKVKKGQEFLVDYGSGYDFTRLNGSDTQ